MLCCLVVALEKLVYDLSCCAERKLDIKILSSQRGEPPSLATPMREVVSLKRLMSAFGTKRTYRVALHMSAIGGKADIGRTRGNVLLTQNGH